MDKTELACTLDSGCDCVRILHAIVEIIGARLGPDCLHTSRLMLAIDEMFANISQHGYGENSGRVDVSFVARSDKILIEFRDYAKSSQLDDMQGRTLENVRPGGLGMHFIREIMSDIHHEALPDGNRWKLTYKHVGGDHAA